MIKTVLAWALVGIVLAVVLLLFINGGGVRSIVQTAGSVPSLRDFLFGVASSSTQFQLPGQEGVFDSLGIEPETGESYAAGSYGDTSATPSAGGVAPQYGNASASAGVVDLEATNAYATSASEEYVSLFASGTATAPIDVSGWSIISMKTGTRLVIPLAASPFIPGTANRVSGVVLDTNGSAIVYTGISPIGVSFRENQCTAYLREMQSYNTCVNQYHAASGFYLPSWRLFAGYTKEIWNNSGDTLYLVDREGRLVDTASY